jgi:hypothetical protein
MSIQEPSSSSRRSPTCKEAARALTQVMDRYGLAATARGYIALDLGPMHHDVIVLIQVTTPGKVVIKRTQRGERRLQVFVAFDITNGVAGGWVPLIVADHTTGHLRFLRDDQGADARVQRPFDVGRASAVSPWTYGEWVGYLDRLIPWLTEQLLAPGTRLVERGISPR